MIGYGLTETFASSLLSLPGDYATGHCGPVAPSCEIRLKDVPQMGYTASDLPNPRGELLQRGYTVFKSYYKDDANTAEAFDGDWFRTGDVAEIDKEGRVYIIDRIKNFFKVRSLYVGFMISWHMGSISLQNVSKIYTVNSRLLQRCSSTAIVPKKISSPSSHQSRSHLPRLHPKLFVATLLPKNSPPFIMIRFSKKHY